ncbi:hypothetical protein LSCM4_07385 [Leishmania orientalis]|uniref:Uncharacterized protein n=1 Tax=Leishmania orientalis TaxID=2249476 RepID=A0A836KT97_9TRYP|nr:hypothetical protein LSCM4_07385 [Leishmania orientalis]
MPAPRSCAQSSPAGLSQPSLLTSSYQPFNRLWAGCLVEAPAEKTLASDGERAEGAMRPLSYRVESE